MMFSTIVRLSPEELIEIKELLSKIDVDKRVRVRAEILLRSNRGEGVDAIAQLAYVSRTTVQKVRNRFRKGGFVYAMSEDKRTGAGRKLSEQGMEYIRYVLGTQPGGASSGWTLELLKKELVRAGFVQKNISLTTISSYMQLAQKTHALNPAKK